MKINKLGFMSILALLGILGTFTGRHFEGFFGFAYYVRYFFVTPDEMFQQNVKKAASTGFFSGVAAMGIAVMIHTLFPGLIASSLTLAAPFVVSVFSFTIMLVVLELNELRG